MFFQINHITQWYKPWFYKHVESFLKKGGDYEYVPLEDYLLRHNRAIFWVVETMIPFGNNPLFRLLCGWLLPPKIAFLKFTTTPGVRAMTFTKQVCISGFQYGLTLDSKDNVVLNPKLYWREGILC